MEDKLHFLIWVAMFITAISIMSYVYGYTDNIQYFFADDEEVLAPSRTDIDGNETYGFPNQPKDLQDVIEEDGIIAGIIFYIQAGVENTIDYLFNVVPNTVKSIPVIGAIWEGLEWAYTGFIFILSLLTLQIFPEEMPIILRVLYVTPIYAGILYIIVPVVKDLLQNIPTT